MEERRRAPRVSIREAGLASKIKHLLLSALRTSRPNGWDPVMDLSLTGVCFKTAKALDPQQTLLLTLRIDKRVPPIELEGSVVRVGGPDAGGRRRVGIQFTDYKKNAWATLRQFEKEYVSRPQQGGTLCEVGGEVRGKTKAKSSHKGHTPKVGSAPSRDTLSEAGDSPVSPTSPTN